MAYNHESGNNTAIESVPLYTTTPPQYGDEKAISRNTAAPANNNQQIYQEQYAPQAQPEKRQPFEDVTPLPALGDEPQWIRCPHCEQRTQTVVQKNNSTMTYVEGVVIGFFCICLACMPCILDWSQDRDYLCGGCGVKVAYKPNNGVIQLAPVAPKAGNQQYGQSYESGVSQPQPAHMQGSNMV